MCFQCLFQLLIVGGSFGLKEFTQIRYDAQRIRRKVCCKLILTLHILNGEMLMINVTVSLYAHIFHHHEEPPLKHLKGQRQCLHSQRAMTPPSG